LAVADMWFSFRNECGVSTRYTANSVTSTTRPFVRLLDRNVLAALLVRADLCSQMPRSNQYLLPGFKKYFGDKESS
jgi:hypothetical protein